MGRPAFNFVGMRRHRLQILERTGTRMRGTTPTPEWRALCDCGRVCLVTSADLRHGQKSCGCAMGGKPRHGWFGTSEYSAWAAMIRRCTNPRSANYRLYGGRGITVCQEWRKDFVAFLRDLGPKPTPTHSLDRINNDGNYEPGNVRWATPKQQARNKRTSRVLVVDGVSSTLAEWAERSGIGRTTIRERLARGWSKKRAVVQGASSDAVAPADSAPASTTCTST